MATQRHTTTGSTRWALLVGVLFLAIQSAMAPPTPLLAMPARPQTAAPELPLDSIAVTTTADAADGDTASFAALLSQPGADGAISLREALLATSTMTTPAALTISFDIPAGGAGYSSANTTWTITLGMQALPALARGNVTIDGTTQPGPATRPRIVLDGAGVYEAAGLSNGFTILSASNTIRGLTLMNFYDDGVLLDGPAAAFNRIAGCYIGVGPEGGAAPSANFFGVEIRSGAHDNMIGGAGAADRNLIGGAEHSGLLITGAATSGNTVAGNWIGVDASGQAALRNKVAGVVLSDGAHANTIGGAGQGNLLSGNDIGIYLDGATDTLIAGNIIGLAANGKTPLGNSTGGIFAINAAQNNQIGGATPALRNVISGNGAPGTSFGQGIYISDINSAGNAISGNYIGTDSSGIAPAGNYRQGILISAGAQNNQIGGTAAGAGNVIAYNGLGGIRIDSPYNRVQGNLVGVGADGATRLGNQSNGVRIGGNNNTVGPGNIISNNQHSGLLLLGGYTSVQGNTLEQNGRSGICVAGPNTTLDANLIRGNGTGSGPWLECALRSGIVISSTDSTLVTDNTITANAEAGITVYGGQSNRLLGNSISGNQGLGIRLLSGGNNNVTAPLLRSTANDTLRGQSCPSCRVEVFTDTSNQGRDFVGATVAGSDGNFALALDPQKLSGPRLTATQTDALGNTSPFAAAVAAPQPAPPPPPATRWLYIPIALR